MTFLWHALNFRIFLEENYSEAALEVFRNLKNSAATTAPVWVSISPFPSQNLLAGEKNLVWKSLHSGRMACDFETLRFWHFVHEPLHPPMLLSTVLMQLVKSIGLHFGHALLHSACVVYNDTALLIPGKEGRGKTTLSQLLPGRILNDDLSLIVKNGDGTFEVYRVPTHQDLKGPHPFTWEGPFRIERVIFLRRENPVGLQELPPTLAKTHHLEEGPLLDFPDFQNYALLDQRKRQIFFDEMLEVIPSSSLSYDPTRDGTQIGAWIKNHSGGQA